MAGSSAAETFGVAESGMATRNKHETTRATNERNNEFSLDSYLYEQEGKASNQRRIVA